MAADSIGAAEIIDNAVGSAALASNSVTNVKMADNAVGTSELVNDAVVMQDKFNRNLNSGMTIFDAVSDAGKSRFRAISLTTITTFVGLSPLIWEKSFQAQFLIPMAISVAFGVLFGTIILLLYFPYQK